MFFHHIGIKGAGEDFPKTIYNKVSLDRVERHLHPNDPIKNVLRRRFESGECNVWGVPGGATPVIRSLDTGDAVLLIDSAAGQGSVPILCPNVIYRNEENHSLSQELWGSSRFPYVFYFDAEHLDMTWEEMCQDLDFKLGWQPRYFYRILPERLVRFGDAEGYLKHVRSRYGLHSRMSNDGGDASLLEEPEHPYTPHFPTLSRVSSFELHQLGEAESVSENADVEVSNALQQLLEQVQLPPTLTAEGPKTNHTVEAPYRSTAFRVAVKRLYESRCAVCGSSLRSPEGKTEVQAAHIYPKKFNGSDDPRNGICLCTRHHWAFDVGWFSLTDTGSILVRDDLPRNPDFDFIRDFAGRSLSEPMDSQLAPHPIYLQQHRILHGFDSERGC